MTSVLISKGILMKTLLCLCFLCLGNLSWAHQNIIHTGSSPELNAPAHLSVGDQVKTLLDLKGKPTPSKRDGNVSYWVERTNTSKNINYKISIRNRERSFRVIQLRGLAGDCELQWVSEKTLFIRAHWSQKWGADYIINIDSGALIYSEKFTSHSH